MDGLYKIVKEAPRELPDMFASKGALEIAYDQAADIVVIDGIRYSGGFFRAFAYGIQEGQLFEFVRREPDGTVTLRTVILEKP